MNIAVVGTGYVGLTTAVTLAYLGHRVTAVDVNAEKIDRLRAGQLPIYEPGLKELLDASGERLTFTTSYAEALLEADVVFVAVGTPSQEDGSPDLTYLNASLEEMLVYLRHKETTTLLVTKSTVPVGTGDRMEERIRREGLDGKVTVASNPEFLRQGQAVADTLYPERIVVGGNETAWQIMREVYSAIVAQSFSMPALVQKPARRAVISYIEVGRRSAELSKYAANAFLAMKISFINEIANVCERVGADVEQVADIIGKDTRIGSSFLRAGIGYGGSCFPKDTNALHYMAGTNGYDFKLLSAVIEVNNAQKLHLVHKAKERLGTLYGKKLAVLGLTFKPGTDDLRESPSLAIIEALAGEGARVFVHDPIALEKAAGLVPEGVQLAAQVGDALAGAEAALLITEWAEYVNLDPAYLRSVMLRPLLLDGRNAWNVDKRTLLEYDGIGTLTASPARLQQPVR
ncbi:UDP-glucose dehydrogenase family protein [Paenibacillus silviterrae]|uniref:UDP-glucose dehydrogenase family protein n=1 Tax=Paenibacillus silviterrae TaxID=3242194 RepID=UPI002543290F|nr:UDP-glucose/GDP-mannose dehydrogenase family protein [Paenibacillus chinjuensis]